MGDDIETRLDRIEEKLEKITEKLGLDGGGSEEGDGEQYATFIVDESGSMADSRREAIDGFNEQVEAIREADDDPRVSLVTFNGKSIDSEFWMEDPDRMRLLEEEGYEPGSLTPFYDAFCRTVDRLRDEAPDGDHLVIVISDGKENDSEEFAAGDVRSRVQELRDEGWEFVYICDNQDLGEVQTEMDFQKAASFDSSAAGTAAASEVLADATRDQFSGDEDAMDELVGADLSSEGDG